MALAGVTYETLSEELIEAVTDGDFNNYLHENAAEDGLDGLLNATSNSVNTTDLTLVLTEASSSNDGLR